MAHNPAAQNIPNNARCVFRGVFFDTYQWRQKMFDGSFRIFESVKRPDSTLIIPVLPSGKIILQHQKQPATGWFISFPGGVNDPGETPRTAALRELFEETGLQPQTFTVWKTLPPQFRVNAHAHVYIARGCVQSAKPHPEGGEKIKLFTVSFDQLLTIAQKSNFRHPHITIEALRALAYPAYKKKLRRLILGK